MGIGNDRVKIASKFIDRDKETRFLIERLEAARSGTGTLVFVEGEAGIGKSRLITELGKIAHDKGFKFLTGRCIAQQDVDPYIPFFEALRDYIQRSEREASTYESDLPLPLGLTGMTRGAAASYPEHVEGGIPLGLAMLTEPTPSRIGAQAERERWFETITQLLVKISKESPVLLFLDDMQWADYGSLQLLHYIARNTRRSRLMICCAYRPEELRMFAGGTHPLTETMRKMSNEKLYEKLELPRMGFDDMSALVKGLLRIEDIPQHFLRRLYDESEGNPFFVEEVLRSLIEEGLIKTDTYVWDGGVDLSTIRIPGTIKDVMTRRLSRMDESTRRVLMYASVIGTKFNFEVLSRVTEMDHETLLDSLDKLIGLGIIREDHSTPDEVYLFDHKQTATAMYEGLSKSRARLMHAKVERAMEEAYAGRTDDVVYSLARHAFLGRDHVKAYHYSVAAGEKARKLLALEEALSYFATALKVLPHIVPSVDAEAEEMMLRMACGDIYTDLGNWGAALPYYQQVVKAAKAKGNMQVASVAMLRQADMHKQRAEYDRAEGLYNEALDISRGLDDVAGMADAERGLGYVHWRQGEFDDAIAHYGESIAQSTKIHDRHAIARVYIELGNVYNQRGDQAKAAEHYKKSITDLEQIGDYVELARAYNNLGDSYLHTREWDKALEAFERCRTASEKVGNRNFVAWALFNAAEALAHKGDLDKAEEYCDRSLKICEAIDDKIGMNGVFKNYGIIYRLKKEWDRSIENLNKSIVLLEMLTIPYDLAQSYFELGLTYK
ncbi:MAG: tetratricopeptide repeat protein, partial [Candidatus Thermoplasmatota archaeon]